MKVAHDADFSKKDALENYSSVAKQALTKLNPTDGHDPVSQWALTDALLGKKPDIAFIPFDGKPTPKLGGALYNNTKPLDKVVAVGPVLVPQELSNGVLTKNTDITTYFKKLGELDPAPKRVIIPIALQPGGGKVNHMVIAVKEGDKVTIFDPLGQTSSYKDQFTPFLSEAGIKPENIQWGKHKTVETNGLHCGDWGAWFTESIASDLSIPMTEEGINTAITSKLGTDGYDARMSEKIFPKHVQALTSLDQEVDKLVVQRDTSLNQTKALNRIESTLAITDANVTVAAKIKMVQNSMEVLKDVDLTKHKYPDGLTILQKLEKTANPELIAGVKDLLTAHEIARSARVSPSPPEPEVPKKAVPESSTTLSVAEIMKQEAAKRRQAMGYSEAAPKSPQSEVAKKAPVVEAQPLAKDTVIFDSAVPSKQLPRVSLSDAIDPITQAIRKEVIQEQQNLLKNALVANLGEPDKGKIQNYNPEEFRQFLGSSEGKQKVADVIKREPSISAKLQDLEVTGYKKVHTQFQDSFRNVDWAPPANNVRTTKVTNDAGLPVCSLTETTVNTKPVQVKLEDGSVKTVNSYRTIDFPIDLDTGNGPMHVSMAVKDENGKNIPEKDAVYFTAHYDKSGKLTEVSSPVPVKFMGEGKDAVGYIERNGKVYTLPVTQDKYQKMMIEVAKNQGLNVDISQQVSTETQDKVVTTSIPDQPKTIAPKKTTGVETPIIAVEAAPTKAKVVDPKAVVETPPKTPLVDKPRPQQESDKPKFSEFEIQLQQAKKDLKQSPSKPSGKETPTETQKYESLLKTTRDNLRHVPTPKEIQDEVTRVRTNLENQASPGLKRPDPRIEELALNTLKGKSEKEAAAIITTTIKEGKADLVEAMVKLVIPSKDKDKAIPTVGKVALRVAYEEGMTAAEKNPQARAKIERASGKIAGAAGIAVAEHLKRTGGKSKEGMGI